jgi:hypothetical protein
MKAIVCRAYGSVAIEERDPPSVPDDAALVRVRAGALNTLDWFLAMGTPSFTRLMAGGIRRPRVHVVGLAYGRMIKFGRSHLWAQQAIRRLADLYRRSGQSVEQKKYEEMLTDAVVTR